MEMRQLKICATCFDISVGLLRVLEMVVNVASNIFLDAENPSAEILLGRLYQVSFLSQVLKLCIFVSFQLLFSDKYFISVYGSLPNNENSPWFCIINIEWLSCQFFQKLNEKYPYQPNIYEVHTKHDALVYCKVV